MEGFVRGVFCRLDGRHCERQRSNLLRLGQGRLTGFSQASGDCHAARSGRLAMTPQVMGDCFVGLRSPRTSSQCFSGMTGRDRAGGGGASKRQNSEGRRMNERQKTTQQPNCVRVILYVSPRTRFSQWGTALHSLLSIPYFMFHLSIINGNNRL